MSIDLIAYFTKKPPAFDEQGPGDRWVLNVAGPMAIEADDIDPALQPLLKRCRWRLDITLEGAPGPEGIAALEALKSELLHAHDARIHDPQADTVETAAGVEAALRVPGDEDEPFELCVYFENAGQVDRDKMSALLDIIEATLPEALPHRYGEFEPPEWRWSEGGKAAYLDRWEPDFPPFSMCRTPARYMYSSFAPGAEAGFAPGEFTFEFRPALAEQPQKLAAAMRMAERMAVELDAFYAALVRGRHGEGAAWSGVFPAEHLLMILGPPVLALWPEFEAMSRPLGARLRVATIEGGAKPVAPPPELAAPSERARSAGFSSAGG